MHDKGASLDQIYKWASGNLEMWIQVWLFAAFVQNFKKDAKGKIIVATNDLKFLQSIAFEMKHTKEQRSVQAAPLIYP